MSKIQKAFEGKKAFIPFITCGDPNLETTEQWKALWQLLTGRQPEEAGGEGHGIHRQEKVFPCRSY